MTVPSSRHQEVSPEERLLHENTREQAKGSESRQGPSRSGPRNVHVEVVLQKLCTDRDAVRAEWRSFLDSGSFSLCNEQGMIDMSLVPHSIQRRCLSARLVMDDDSRASASSFSSDDHVTYHIHPYTLSDEEPTVEELEPTDGGDEWTAACDNIPIPHASLESSWEALILANGIKQKLLDYAQSALLFSDKGVSSHIVSWNRLLLLHGPPGTGKTSLCRALAHKLAIRMSHRFPSGANLLEIQSHSLFSKWFSTSGKLVNRLFELVREMVQDDPKTLVCVLVDEVESLAGSRSSSLGGAGEPPDAMRAVNALLTSLDRLRTFPNVLVLATTNLTASVDLAFIDRADVKQYIGMPILEARYEIFRSCVQELIRVGIIRVSLKDDYELCPFHEIHKSTSNERTSTLSRSLLRCAEEADGLSGRSLRRLPLQTHAQFIRAADVSVEEFLDALKQGVASEQEARIDLQKEMGDNTTTI